MGQVTPEWRSTSRAPPTPGSGERRAAREPGGSAPWLEQIWDQPSDSPSPSCTGLGSRVISAHCGRQSLAPYKHSASPPPTASHNKEEGTDSKHRLPLLSSPAASWSKVAMAEQPRAWAPEAEGSDSCSTPRCGILDSSLTLSEPALLPLPLGDHLGPTSWNSQVGLRVVYTKPQNSAHSQWVPDKRGCCPRHQ